MRELKHKDVKIIELKTDGEHFEYLNKIIDEKLHREGSSYVRDSVKRILALYRFLNKHELINGNDLYLLKKHFQWQHTGLLV